MSDIDTGDLRDAKMLRFSNVRALRTRRSLTKEQLALTAGVSVGTLTTLEKRNCCTAAKVFKLFDTPNARYYDGKLVEKDELSIC